MTTKPKKPKDIHSASETYKMELHRAKKAGEYVVVFKDAGRPHRYEFLETKNITLDGRARRTPLSRAEADDKVKK